MFVITKVLSKKSPGLLDWTRLGDKPESGVRIEYVLYLLMIGETTAGAHSEKRGSAMGSRRVIFENLCRTLITEVCN